MRMDLHRRGDRIETVALKRAFCEHAYKLAVSSRIDDRHCWRPRLEAGITVLALPPDSTADD